MSDMFGAPIGQSAAEADIRQNNLATVQAQEILGKIAMQPAQQQLAEAHAKLYGAEADAKVAAVEAQQKMEALSRDYLIQTKSAQGQVATVNDIGATGRPVQRSAAAPLKGFIDYARARGTSETVLVPLEEKAAKITQEEAVTAHNFAMASTEQENTKKKKAEAVSQWATAALAHPELYPQMLMMAASAGAPVDMLPKQFNSKILDMVRVGGIAAAKSAELRLKAIEDGSQAALRNAEITKANASVSLAEARRDLEVEKFNVLKKYGGDTAEATLRQKQVSVEAKQGALAAQDAKNFKALPLDPRQYIVDQGYTINGGKYIYIGKDADGKPRFEPLASAGRMKAKEIANSSTLAEDD